MQSDVVITIQFNRKTLGVTFPPTVEDYILFQIAFLFESCIYWKSSSLKPAMAISAFYYASLWRYLPPSPPKKNNDTQRAKQSKEFLFLLETEITLISEKISRMYLLLCEPGVLAQSATYYHK